MNGHFRHMLAAAFLVPVLAGCGSMSAKTAGEPAPSLTMNSPAGTVLTNQNGLTLYTYDSDGNGVSNCTGLCAAAWPPVLAQPDSAPTGHLTIITRPDGTKQWAQDGKPLYLFSQDHKPGDIRGDGLDGTWQLARPE
jgi:predicted lipoprotein with Yx(FWY)xxD motif